MTVNSIWRFKTLMAFFLWSTFWHFLSSCQQPFNLVLRTNDMHFLTRTSNSQTRHITYTCLIYTTTSNQYQQHQTQHVETTKHTHLAIISTEYLTHHHVCYKISNTYKLCILQTITAVSTTIFHDISQIQAKWCK